jgi:hypothetical protein
VENDSDTRFLSDFPGGSPPDLGVIFIDVAAWLQPFAETEMADE